ncbi:hypothetical protein MYAM1_001276 [Malassezia yamatoensis]|uniref:Uncharacterized protein n=1 Tax=Malassezia yamatoensis TaxID=253288 RepID=A0AAJ6CH99_9BASI|nr:hypothetical protein MYAM1_001276 [Malassezia yamatoensis]
MHTEPNDPHNAKQHRKFHAIRSPQKPKKNSEDDTGNRFPAEQILAETPWQSGTRWLEGASRNEIYSLVNDRFTGGTKQEPEQTKEGSSGRVVSQRRESSRRSGQKTEWDHLSLNNTRRKRKSSSPYASEAGSSAGSDSENNGSSSRGSRTRRLSSRQGTPAQIIEYNTNVSRLGVTSLPVNPSPLKTQTVLESSQDGRLTAT